MNPITNNSDGLDTKLASDRVIDGLASDIAKLPTADAAPCDTDVADDACGDTYLSEFAAKCQRASMTTDERIAAHNARVVGKVMELMPQRTQQTAKPTPLSSFMHNIRGKATDALNQSRDLATLGEHMPRRLLLQAFHAIRSVAAQALGESGVFKPDLKMKGDFDYHKFAKAIQFEYERIEDDAPRETKLCTEEICVDVEDLEPTDSDEVWGIPPVMRGTWRLGDSDYSVEADWSAHLYEVLMVGGRRVAVYEVMED